MDHLVKLGVDSLKITKIDNQNFKIELAETYAFEQWKIDFEDEIKSSNSRSPKMRPFLMVE